MKLRELRAAALMTQAELGAAAGVGVSTIQSIENGRELPTPRTARKLAKALKVEPADIDEVRAWQARAITSTAPAG